MTELRQASAGSERRVVRTMCPMNCNPTYCGMLVEVEDDRVAGISGDPDNPDSHGFLCVRGRATAEIADNPLRLLRPRLRDRESESGWREADWDEALERIASAIRAAGPEGVGVFHGHGLIPNNLHRQMAQRFANLGGFQWWNPSIVCWGLGAFGLMLTGPLEVNSKEDMEAHAELILLWGANIASQPTTAPHLVAARRRGAHIVAIDVRRSESFAQADEGYLVRPGSDAALALAMIHVIIAEHLYDAAFVAEYTLGFDALATEVASRTPEWAAAETGIAADAIRSLARRYAATRQSMILLGGSSMHKSANGWLAGRAIGCLPGLTGAIGHAGAGFGPRHAAAANGAGLVDLSAVSQRPDGPLPPSEMSGMLEAMEAGRIRVLLLFGTNMLSSFADTARLARALARMDLVVCLDLFMSDTAREFAGIVLPGTSWLEETGYKTTNTHLYLMDQAITPRGEARTASWVMRELARRLDIADFYPWESVDAYLDAVFDHPSTGSVTVARLREQEGRQPLHVSPVAHPDLRFGTPSGKIEFYSERATQLGAPPLPSYEPIEEDARRVPERAARYPLLFRQGRSLTHFHSFYDHGQALPTLAHLDPEPRLWINASDAGERGVCHGQAIRIFNDRGAMEARAEVTERVPAGVVWMRDGWRGLNDLTSGRRVVSDDAARAFPAGAASYEARVEVTALTS